MFWNPAKISEDRQLELDKRVILGIALTGLEKQLNQALKKAKSASDYLRQIDYTNSTKRTIASARNRSQVAQQEVDNINRRIDLIKNELD